MTGLEETQTRGTETFNAVFVDCTVEEQRAPVAHLDDETVRPGAEETGRDNPSLNRAVKELVFLVYYTSEVGASLPL